MRRAPILVTAALAAPLLLAGVAEAQTAEPTAGQAAGLRYLSWTGRSNTPEPGAVAARVDAPVASLRRPNRVIPHGGAAAAPPPRQGLTPAPGPVRRTLTPANAWMQPAVVPAPPPPPASPEPAPASPAAPRALAPVGAMPDYLPDQGGRGQPAPAEAVAPVASPSPADPMAPRRDAPIFHMQRSAEIAPPPLSAAEAAPETADAAEPREPAPTRVALVTANPADRPAMQGARYYSVHRQAGHAPDPVILPQPSYIDALAVTMAETPTSQDLAQPAEPPTLIRDGQGRLRAAPAAPDGDYQ